MEYSGGWLRLYRALIKKPIWKLSTPEQKSILITILCMVNHEEKEWEWKEQKYICKPGQTITSLEKIRQEAGKGITIQNIRTSLERFKKLDFLTNESTKESRLITVLNWEMYQSDDKELTKELTNGSQRGNKRLTTKEECKNDKNDKEDIYIICQHLSMTKKQHQNLVSEYGKELVDNKIEYAKNYAKLKNYKSLYLTLNNWLKADKKKEDKPKDHYRRG